MSQDRPPFVLCRTITAPVSAVILSTATFVVVVSSVIASDDDVPGWEREALFFFNDWPDRLEPLMWFVQQPGNLFAPVIAGAIVVWFTRRWYYFLPFLLVLPLKLGVEKGIIKQLIDRERPFVSIGPEVNVRGGAFEGPSFPSGHATTAFAMFVLVAAFVPSRWRFLPLSGAALVAVGRLYFGEHNFLDVVAGAALGTAFAALLWLLFLNRCIAWDASPPPGSEP